MQKPDANRTHFSRIALFCVGPISCNLRHTPSPHTFLPDYIASMSAQSSLQGGSSKAWHPVHATSVPIKKERENRAKAFDGTKQWSHGLLCCSCISVDRFQSRMPASLHRNSDMDGTNMSRSNEYNNIIEQGRIWSATSFWVCYWPKNPIWWNPFPAKSPSYSYNNNNNNSERVVPLEDWRRKICQWAFRVIDHFRLDREIVSTGMNLFDRFLLRHQSTECDPAAACFCPSCKRSLDSPTYQLAAMTCVFLAVKLHSQNNSHHPATEDSSSSCRGGGGRRSHKQFKLNTFVELSRGQFRAQDICDMEATVLATLRWKVNVREAFCREFAQVRGEASSSHTHGSIPHLRSVLQRALWPNTIYATCLSVQPPILIDRHFLNFLKRSC